MYVQWLYCLIK